MKQEAGNKWLNLNQLHISKIFLLDHMLISRNVGWSQHALRNGTCTLFAIHQFYNIELDFFENKHFVLYA